MRYCMFRLKESANTDRIRFESISSLQQHGHWPIDPDNYELIFHGDEAEGNFSGMDTYGVLEYLFRKFNGGNMPDYYKADYGLSMGDIVLLDDAAALAGVEEGAYFCDRIGFEFLGMRLSHTFMDRT